MVSLYINSFLDCTVLLTYTLYSPHFIPSYQFILFKKFQLHRFEISCVWAHDDYLISTILWFFRPHPRSKYLNVRRKTAFCGVSWPFSGLLLISGQIGSGPCGMKQSKGRPIRRIEVRRTCLSFRSCKVESLLRPTSILLTNLLTRTIFVSIKLFDTLCLYFPLRFAV